MLLDDNAQIIATQRLTVSET